MQYFFIGGTNSALSLAELAAVFPGRRLDFTVFKAAAGQTLAVILKPEEKIDAAALIRRLGGTVKTGTVADTGPLKRDGLPPAIIRLVAEHRLNPPRPASGPAKGRKLNFGLSYYGNRRFETKPLAMAIKKELRAAGVSSRWVTSREPVLSSVVVEQNRLLKDGLEIVMIETGGGVRLGQTAAVQPFKELSFRDYGRPARDDRSGLLPPKLAQIMINLARVPQKGSILDPFCGSGTILSEALLMGHENLLGSDISPRAIADAQKNLAWLKSSHSLRVTSYELRVSDATRLSGAAPPGSIDAIITEPYLGPQRGHPDIAKTAKELEALYSRALREFSSLLSPGGRVVMVWPVFREKNKAFPITPEFNGFAITDPLPDGFRAVKKLYPQKRRTLLYGRDGQKVWREIVVLTKI